MIPVRYKMNMTAMRSVTTLGSLMTTDDSDRMTMTMSSTTLVDLLGGIDVKISMDRSKTNIFDSDLDVSPVTLSSDWSRVARLLLLASLAVVGSVGNVFMISAIMVEDHLKKRGTFFIIIVNCNCEKRGNLF